MEKVGIVGRTGSGKSTIMGAIFRLLELESGHILLGGVDVSTVGVGLLRRLVTIVPQDPILFSGELRKNLDPLNARTDDKIWSALTRCSLDSFVGGLDGGLAAHIAEGGSNFSVGERQVLCLARALLREAPVLCLDEATANVDPTNDKRIQEILVTEVKGCLVLTIAHRLHTVLHSNRILVLDHGRLAQNDSPKALLATPGLFRDLANQAGITSASVPMAFGDDATRIESV
jgi:ABC-type multidrug transport system fused ATPase/permease subunit